MTVSDNRFVSNVDSVYCSVTCERVGTLWERRGNVLAVRSCCYVAVYTAARAASAPTGEELGGGISWRPPAYSLFFSYFYSFTATAGLFALREGAFFSSRCFEFEPMCPPEISTRRSAPMPSKQRAMHVQRGQPAAVPVSHQRLFISSRQLLITGIRAAFPIVHPVCVCVCVCVTVTPSR